MSRELIDELARLRDQYVQLTGALQSLPEDQQAAGAPFIMMQMILTRVAMVDAKVDLVASRIMPETARAKDGPRIVMPGRQ